MITTGDIPDMPTTPHFSPDKMRHMWAPLLECPPPLIIRIRDAWEVLTGRAHAIKQSEQSDYLSC